MYAIVMFNFKKRQKVRTSFLIPMGGAVPRPELAVSIFSLHAGKFFLIFAVYSCVDPEEGTGGPDPSEKLQNYRVS